jgi:hypothetical protein
LISATGIDSSEQPCAKHTEKEEQHSVGDHCHLKEAGKDREVNKGFGCLSVVGST